MQQPQPKLKRQGRQVVQVAVSAPPLFAISKCQQVQVVVISLLHGISISPLPPAPRHHQADLLLLLVLLHHIWHCLRVVSYKGQDLISSSILIFDLSDDPADPWLESDLRLKSYWSIMGPPSSRTCLIAVNLVHAHFWKLVILEKKMHRSVYINSMKQGKESCTNLTSANWLVWKILSCCLKCNFHF